MDVDVSELDRLAADLGSVGDNSGPFIRKAVEVTAMKVKNNARDAVRGRKYFKGGASAINYELKGLQGFGATVLDAEIGYDNDKARGKLGNLIEQQIFVVYDWPFGAAIAMVLVAVVFGVNGVSMWLLEGRRFKRAE